MLEGHLRDVLRELGVTVVTKNNSGWLVCHCPFAPLGYHKHGKDRDPSFFVRPNAKGFSGYNCFTCKQHGTVSQLVAKLEHESGVSYGNLSARAMLREASVDFGEFGDHEETEQPPSPLDEALYCGVYPFAWESDRAMQYLSSRGVTERAVRSMGLLYDEDGFRVMFPVRGYNGELWGYSGRSVIPDDERQNAKVKDYAGLKKRWVILGEELVRKADDWCSENGTARNPLLVVEGLFAYAHMISLGVQRVACPVATLGSVLSVYQRDRLAALERPVYFLYDDDVAGDVGLYGKQDADTKQHIGGGALDMMRLHVPTYVCLYPDRFGAGEGDPDRLTYEEVRAMIDTEHELICS